jgi:oligoribonuclease
VEHHVALLISRHHTASGLYSKCLESQLSIKEAESAVIEYLIKLGIGPGQLTIAGNSIHMDKLFLFHHMPKLNQFLHYRILDVSSIKIVVNAMTPKLFYKKQNSHRALDDIRESIGELAYYMKYSFK